MLIVQNKALESSGILGIFIILFYNWYKRMQELPIKLSRIIVDTVLSTSTGQVLRLPCVHVILSADWVWMALKLPERGFLIKNLIPWS